MDTIGLRDLTHHTAAIARRVRAGETIVVTDHGKPVIRMSPATPGDEALSGLLAAGLLIRAQTPGYLPEPMDTGVRENASDIVSELRDDRF